MQSIYRYTTITKLFMIVFTASLLLANGALAKDDAAMSHQHDQHNHQHDHDGAVAPAVTETATTAMTSDNDKKIVVTVSGMVCDFCARGIEKSFAREASTEKVVVSLADGLVTLFVKADASISDATITTLITDNGISVNDIQR